MKEIRPEHVEHAFRRLHDFSTVQAEDMKQWSGDEIPDAFQNLNQSVGLTPDAAEKFRLMWRELFGSEEATAMLALDLGLLMRRAAEED